MNRRKFIALTGASTAAIATAGCITGTIGNAGSTEPDDVTLDEVEGLNVQATDRNTIQVNGSGTVTTDPDSAVLSVSIEGSDGEEASNVVDELATRSDQLTADLTAYGIPEDDITTTNYSLGEDSRSNHYEGEHQFRIQLDDSDEVGSVIDVAADSTADEIRRVNFTASDERREELRDQAVDRAVEDARAEAEQFAAAAGVSLGEPVSIETSDSGVSPYSHRVYLTAESDAGAATELQRGQVTVSASVTIEYSFETADEE